MTLSQFNQIATGISKLSTDELLVLQKIYLPIIQLAPIKYGMLNKMTIVL
jgi:hypothetical protein